MKRIYNYGGQVEQGFLRIDLGQIPFYNYVAENIDYEIFQEEQQNIFKQLLIKIAESNQFESVTFNDKRLIFLLVKAMIKYPTCLKSFARGATGMMEFEYILVYQYLIDSYDKSLPQLDSVIRFINLLIGYTYIPEHKFSKAQAEEFNALSDVCNDVAIDYNGILPSFVLKNFDLNMQISENETIADVIDIEESPIINDQIEEQTEDQIEEAIEDVEDDEIDEIGEIQYDFEGNEQAQEMYDSIETIIMFWPDKASKKQINSWKEAIEIQQELISEITGVDVIVNYDTKTGKAMFGKSKMELGGIAQRYSSPALLQFQTGGLVERFSSPLPQTPKFGGDPMMFKGGGKVGFSALAQKVAAAYKGKKVKPKYQKEYGTTYSASEAKEVGNKIAAKVYRAQQKK